MEPQADDGKPAKRWFRRSPASERRKAKRQKISGLVAYYWDGGAPQAHAIRDISSTGLYLLTDQQWYPGTLLTMTLQKTTDSGAGPDLAIAVQTRVMRQGTDGVGFAFVALQNLKQHRGESNMRSTADKKELEEFLQRLHGASYEKD